MQQRKIIYCVRGNQAKKFCMNSNCSVSPIICSQSSCDCERNHKQCMANTVISSLVSKLMAKASQSLKKPNPILKLYDECIKRLVKDRDQYLFKNKDLENGLQGEQKLLYENIKYSKLSQINSNLIYNVYHNLNKDQEQVQNKSFEQFQKIRDKIMRSIKKLKRTWNIQQYNYQFKQELYPSHIFSTKNQGLIIKRHANPTVMTYLALVQPSIFSNDNSSKKIKFKLNRINIDIYIGICHLQTIKQKNFQFFPGQKGGAYMVNNVSGIFYSSTNNHQQQTTFRAEEGDVIKIEYLADKKLIIFENKTRKAQRIKIQVNMNKNNPLHICFGMYYPNTQVEILEYHQQYNQEEGV